jgi:hypothetical protein
VGTEQGFNIRPKCYYDSDIWKDPSPFDIRSAWEDLIRRAQWEPKDSLRDYGDVKLDRGELITSILGLSRHWRWSRGKVGRFLDKLVKYDRIRYRRVHLADSKVVSKRTHDGHSFLVISICKYDEYQTLSNYKKKARTVNEQPIGSDAEATRTHTNTNSTTILEPTPAKADDEIDDPKVAKRKKLEADVDEFIEFWNELSPVPENPKSIKLRGIVKGGISRTSDELWDAADNYWFCVNSPAHNDYEPRTLAAWFAKEFYRKFLPGFNPRVNYRKKK